MKSYKADFPVFQHHPELIYLDSAATSQKPQAVIDAVTHFYTHTNSNIHRGVYDLSQQATDLFEDTRKRVASFIGAIDPSEVIFTSGTTESINVIASGWAKKYLRPGDVIVLSEMEHHSNIVPWLQLKKELGIELFFLPVNEEFQIVYTDTPTHVLKRVKLVSLTQVSNVLGTVNPIAKIVSFFKSYDRSIVCVVDAAQSIPHMSIDVKKLGCDFVVFSSHKLYGPSGIGILWGKQRFLEEMEPFLVGSHMIRTVTKTQATWAQIPDKFEAGTRNLEGVVGFGAALDYLQRVGIQEIEAYEKKLTTYAVAALRAQSGVFLLRSEQDEEGVGVLSFVMKDIHPHDIAEIFNRNHIAVRAGHHCAQPLMQRLGVLGTVRLSIAIYNSLEDIDRVVESIQEVKRIFHC